MLMLKTHEFRDQIAQAFVKFSGLASELFQKAMEIAPDELHPRKPDRSWRMKCYSLFAKMLEPFPDQVTTEILQRNLKQPDSNPEQTLRGYKSHWYFLRESISCEGYGEFYARADYESLHPFRMVTSDHMYGSIYMDAPVGLVLSYRQVPQAIVSFMPDPQDPESLSIRQLQGILPLRPEATLGRSARYSIRGLARLNWENALIEFAEYVARETRFKSTQIVGSGNIKWASPNYMKMSIERARERYDRTAERMGYNFNPETRNYTRAWR